MQNAGETLYSIFVAVRHAKFNDGGSYLPWTHMFKHDQEAWNETADKFLATANPEPVAALPETTEPTDEPATVEPPVTEPVAETPVQEPVTETP